MTLVWAWIQRVVLVWVMIGALAPVSGSPVRHLSVMGATSVLPYLKASVPLFERLHPGVTVAISGGGSLAGLIEAQRGHVDIGVSDIAPKGPGDPLLAIPLGHLPILFVANRTDGVGELSVSELSSILTGQIVRWSALGGAPLPVVVVTRQLASGAREVVEGLVLKGRPMTRRALVQLSNGALLRTVLDTPGAIGFVEGNRHLSGVTVLAVEGKHFSVYCPQKWPYYAVPSLYVKPGADKLVMELAHFLASRPDRARYGLLTAVRGRCE